MSKKSVIMALSEQEIDDILGQLLSAREDPPQTEISLPEDTIVSLLGTARDILLDQPMLLELNAPISIVGGVYT